MSNHSNVWLLDTAVPAAETDGAATEPVGQRQQLLHPRCSHRAVIPYRHMPTVLAAHSANRPSASPLQSGTIQFLKQLTEGRPLFLCHRENYPKMRRYSLSSHSPLRGCATRSMASVGPAVAIYADLMIMRTTNDNDDDGLEEYSVSKTGIVPNAQSVEGIT